ncbi:hypothetical protein ACDQ55_14280 [Chitinophaga sp. 30R24]|uniref:hypothetical protein n=1 Tax=Chitinophaga sp. 30R24 TaxID=3248838 RepID=UPI003B8F2751
MNSYLKMIADKLTPGRLPEGTVLNRIPDEDTRELTVLMDHIPNAKSVAAMYRQMIKAGRLDERFTTGDPGMGWLAAEQLLLDRDMRRKENKRKIIWMFIIFMIVGIASYCGGIYLLTHGR